MMNHYQSRILAEAVKHGGTNISKIGKMAQSINEEPVLTGGEAAPTLFGWSKHQFEAKFRELLTRMGFERGIIHIKTEGQEMKMYFANAAKARDFAVAFNGLARRKSMGSVASVATQFNKIKSPTGTNAIVSLDLSVVRGESLDLDGTDLYEWFSEETDTITEGGVKAALADFREDLPKEMVAEIKKIIKLSVVNPTEVMKRKNKIEAIRKKYKIAPDFMGTPTAEVIVDYFNTFHGESVEVEGLTEAPYKTSTGTPKFVGKYQFTPFVEGSISGWFLRVQGFAKEVGFIEKPASKNTKTSVAPYRVYFHTEVSGHPQLKANALPGNETRVIQSNQFRFAPKQLLKGVAMWMDAYGYRMVGEGLESVDFHEGREWNIKHGTSMEDVVDEMGRSGWKPVGKMPSGNFSGNISFRKGQSKAHLVLKGGNPEKWVYESVEVVDGDINEAKKKLTSDQKAALKAYKLSCDMRDRDDLTPDMYRHYDKRAKADAEACKKLGLGKEDGVYESVEVAEATGNWLYNSKIPLLGTFTHATTGKRFDYRMSDDDYGKKHGLPHEIHVGAPSASGFGHPNAETRPGLVKGTVCIIGVDEGADGKPVVEKWKIKQHIIYPPPTALGDPGYFTKWTKWRAKSMRGEEFESENTSLIEATYNKAKPKLITPKEMADYKVKKVLAVGTRPNNESIVATCEWGKKKFVQLEKMGKTGNINQIVQATFFDTEKEAMDEMQDRGFKIHA